MSVLSPHFSEININVMPRVSAQMFTKLFVYTKTVSCFDTAIE